MSPELRDEIIQAYGVNERRDNVYWDHLDAYSSSVLVVRSKKELSDSNTIGLIIESKELIPLITHTAAWLVNKGSPNLVDELANLEKDTVGRDIILY